jgi:hypothetical protein
VRIELPGNLGKAAKAMKMFGKGDQVDALEASMNKAAEAAVPQAQAILVDAVKNMSVTDAKGILSGGHDSATQYLNKSSREQIRAKFLPIVKQATDKVGLAQQYNNFAGQAKAWGGRRQERQHRELRDREGAGRPVRDDRQAGAEHSPEPGAGCYQPGQEGLRRPVILRLQEAAQACSP